MGRGIKLREARFSGSQHRSQSIDVQFLVTVGVTLGVRSTSTSPGIVVGNVGSETTDCSWLTGICPQAGEKGGSGTDVCGPAEPSSVSCIEVHEDVWFVELLDGVGDTLDVCGFSCGTFGNVEVGNQVGKRIRLW